MIAPASAHMTDKPERREIDLHRRVCVITPDTIDIKPARSAAIAPMIFLFLGILCFLGALFFIDSLPFAVVLLLMGAAILLVPFAGMGFVYSVFGANIVINKHKQSALWQQGLFGMGVGTEELVPFWKIERIELIETSRDPQWGGPQDFCQFEVMLLKTSERRLSIGQVTVPSYAAPDGLARSRAVAEAVATLVDKPLHVEVSEHDEPARRRYRRLDDGDSEPEPVDEPASAAHR
jgi:hypothetical protein